jgi:hypothetical protein
MPFQRVDEEQGIGVDIQSIGFDTAIGSRNRVAVNELRLCRALCFDNDPAIAVNLKARVQAQDRGIRVGIGRQAVKLELAIRILNPPVERLELLALEWVTVTGLLERNDDTMLLYVRDSKSIVREWRNECSPVGEVIKFLKERVPTDAEWHEKEYDGLG